MIDLDRMPAVEDRDPCTLREVIDSLSEDYASEYPLEQFWAVAKLYGLTTDELEDLLRIGIAKLLREGGVASYFAKNSIGFAPAKQFTGSNEEVTERIVTCYRAWGGARPFLTGLTFYRYGEKTIPDPID